MKNTEKTALHVAIDIVDDFLTNDHFYDEAQVRALMAYCRSLGATTVQWIFDDMWSFYDTYPDGMDLLRTAIEAAHEQGMKFHVAYKPFEGKLDIYSLLPHSAPRPQGVPLWEDLRGLIPIVRPFVAEHPEMCLQRQAGDEDPGGAVQSIRLIKNDDTPSGLRAEDLSIWISDSNGRFTRYDGSFTLQETSEWRPLFPLGQTCRVLTLGGLDIPQQQHYIEVRLAEGALADNDFCNDFHQIVELVNAAGNVIPSTPAAALPPLQDWVHKLSEFPLSQLVRYAQHPAARAFLDDKKAIDEQASEMRNYGQAKPEREYSLNERRHISVARGKMPYICGVLNPIYPEVREHWLDTVRYCIERGADAVDFRPGHHGYIQESWTYGFNPPVLEELGSEANFAGAHRVIGEAYTQFLREARDLLHAHNREIGVHLLPDYFNIVERKSGDAHDHMEYQWETWVCEIADFAVFRGAMGLREETLQYVVDQFGAACSEAKIPLIYQSNRRGFNAHSPLHLHPDRLRWLEREMNYVIDHPHVNAFQLYEAASFTALNEDGQLEGDTEILELAQRQLPMA